jgi:LPXTG-motif cell wall-anchored protein
MFFRYGAKSGSIELPYSQQAWVTYDYSGAYDTTPTNKWVTLDYQTFVDTRAAIKTASTENHVTGNQRSMLLTYDAMKASIDAGYNVITYRNHGDTTIDWMKILKNMPIDMLKALADLGAKTYAQDDSNSIKTAFDYLKGEVLYLVGSGTLTDIIAPHFDTVIPASGVPYTVTLHGEELTAQSTGTNEWSYGVMDTTTGKYPYVITYAPGADEKFVVQINVPVERSKQLKISYKLQLLTDGLASGKYPTNTSATLEYKDSNGENPGTELFEIPTVVYKGPNVPNTGDENNIYMYGSVMLLALGGAIYLTYNSRKKKYN